MSSLLGSNVATPYVAPWVANWNRYSTQTLTLKQAGAVDAALTVPAGQWWRTVFLTATCNTVVTAGSRLFYLLINYPGNGLMYIAAPAAQAANVSVSYTFGVGLTTYAVAPVGGFGYQVAQLVDMLWPPTTSFQIELTNAVGADALLAGSTLAVEIYTEHVDADTGVPVLIPSPVLT